MDPSKEINQVFHPSSVPVDRAVKQREERKQSCRFCIYIVVALLAIFGGLIIVGGSYLIWSLSTDFLFPTKSLALHHKHVQPFNASQVHPLITKSTSFDINAVVWQDVTGFLDSGGELPHRDEPWQLLESVLYKRIGGNQSNETRKQVIVWSGKIAPGASFESKVHTLVPLRIPVSPLYTNRLGRSSLRATFSVSLPEEQARSLGKLSSTEYMLPFDLPFLQQRIDYEDKPSAHDLDTALIDGGISTSLLELVPSPYFRTDSDGQAANRTIGDGTAVSPFFDRHPSNLHFLDPTSSQFDRPADGRLPELRGKEGRILLPHFRTRTRIGMARITDVFDNTTFVQQQLAGRIQMRNTCSNWNNALCERQYRKAAFETLLNFTKPLTSAEAASGDEAATQQRLFYGPVLTQSSTPGMPQFQRRIPHRMPTLDGLEQPATLQGNASAACEIPPARLDASGQFFELDWHVYFSSHTLQRAVLGESDQFALVRPPPAPLHPGEEGDKELIANSIPSASAASSADRFLTGDRYHAKDRTSWMVVGGGVLGLWLLIVDEILLFWFWYTRKTSAGLWIEAQWLWVGMHVVKFAVDLIRPFVEGQEDPLPSLIGLFFSSTMLFHIPFVVLTLLHLVRPANFVRGWRNILSFRRRRLTRREIHSKNLGKSIDKRPFYLLFAAFFLFYILIDHPTLVLNPAERCLVDDAGGRAFFPLSRRIFEETIRSLESAVFNTQLLAQVYFNYRSRTFTGCFRIAAIGTALVTTPVMLLTLAEGRAGWVDKRYSEPITVGVLFEVGLPLMLAYQAVVYRGVPQVVGEDEEEE